MSDEAFEGWAIVELFGHRRLAGHVQEVEMFGGRRLRLDVPAPEGKDGPAFVATQYYAGSAVYCLTPTDEATARAVAAASQPAPVQRWELPQLEARSEPEKGGEW